VQDITESSATVFPGVPFMFDALAGLRDDVDFSSINRTIAARAEFVPRMLPQVFLCRKGLTVGIRLRMTNR